MLVKLLKTKMRRAAVAMSFVPADSAELERHTSRIVIVNERNQAVQAIDQPTVI
jgi:aspartate 1-decarboxylase